MLIEADVEQEVLEQCLESSYQQIQDQDGLAGLRAKAWKRYQELGLPDGRLEAYRYIQRKQLYAQRYSLAERVELDPALIEAALLPGCEGSALVMVNGCYCPDLSRTANLPEQLVVGGLEEAMRTYGAFLKNRWQRTLKEEQDPFVAANAALAPAGVFIYVPPKLKVDVPLQVIQLTAAGERPMLCLPRVVAFLGVQAELQVMHTAQHVSGESYGVNQVFDWTLDDGARVDFASFVEEEPATVWRLDAVRARLKRDAFFRTNSSSFGTKTHRQDYRVSLNGENACARLKGLWVTRDTRQVHSHVLIEHNAPHCESMQLFKGALYDTSKSSFEGKIFVAQEAQKTDAFQLNNNLLLGPHAQAYSKPNLEIFADDVKASHGATVGQLDEKALFYLQTRGVSRSEAQAMCAEGFALEVADQIPLEALRERVAVKVKSKL